MLQKFGKKIDIEDLRDWDSKTFFESVILGEIPIIVAPGAVLFVYLTWTLIV